MSDFRFGSYGFFYFTASFFILSLIGHAVFEWFAYINDQADRGAVATINGYLIIFLRDTLENWQSEFLQLIWQVAGLAFLLHVGSPQSKEGDDRKEEKLDAILRAVDPQKRAEANLKFGQKICPEIGRIGRFGGGTIALADCYHDTLGKNGIQRKELCISPAGISRFMKKG